VKIKTLYNYCEQVGRRGKHYETNNFYLYQSYFIAIKMDLKNMVISSSAQILGARSAQN
jgi:hypothetical protein